MHTLSLILLMAICNEPKRDVGYIVATDTPHACGWSDCELKGQYIFDGTVNNKYPFDSKHNKTTSNYYFDKMHFEHPSFSKSEIRDLVNYNSHYAIL